VGPLILVYRLVLLFSDVYLMQRRSQKVNQATPSLSHSPVKAPVPEETTGTSSYYTDENHSAGSEIQRPQYGRRSWLGSEPSTLEIDVYVRRYSLLVVLARSDDDDDRFPDSTTSYCPLQQYLVDICSEEGSSSCRYVNSRLNSYSLSTHYRVCQLASRITQISSDPRDWSYSVCCCNSLRHLRSSYVHSCLCRLLMV